MGLPAVLLLSKSNHCHSPELRALAKAGGRMHCAPGIPEFARIVAPVRLVTARKVSNACRVCSIGAWAR